MVNYRKTQTDFIENLSVDILKSLGINAKRNNLNHIGNVDILVDGKVRIDIQYSQNFSKYGDLRVDFISAYSKDIKGQENSKITIFKKFEETYGLKVDKVGKYFQDDYLDAVMVLFYDNKLNLQDKEKQMPNSIMIITKNDIMEYVSNNAEQLFKNIKFNNKEGLGDTHGSAFLPIKVSDLEVKTNCFFGTIEKLKESSDEIKQYLSNLSK